MKWVLSAAAVVILAALIARKQQSSQSSQPFNVPSDWDNYETEGTQPDWSNSLPWSSNSNEPSQSPNLFEEALVTMDPRNYLPANVPADVAARNVRAFLDMLAVSEGTAGVGDNGYNVFYGLGTFDSYADHPRKLHTFNIKGVPVTSSAAGRYQFLMATWDDLRAKLGLSDFGPVSQDAGAIELIRQRGALRDVQAGRVAVAIDKVRKTWASLPGAGYNQHEQKLSTLLNAYASAGGTNSEAIA